MPDQLQQGALQVVKRLVGQGYQAYLVGGCVRDGQLGRPVKDYDIATSAKPEQVQALFERTIPTGLQHGTVTVLIGRTPYEVTTFRKEGDYEGFRRPSEVEYIDNLQEDLQRRDFTMNAMAMDQDGQLIDPFHGMDDVRAGILRCVGHAAERFSEDALRMLRCLRFASEYGLRIEDSTWQALLAGKTLLRHIAMERVRAELERMLGGRNPDLALQLLVDSGVLDHTKQELQLARIVGAKPKTELGSLPGSLLRLACLYIEMQIDSAAVEEDLRLLTFSKQQIEAVRSMVAAHEMLHSLNEQSSGDEEAGTLKRIWILTALRYGVEAMHGLRQVYRQLANSQEADVHWSQEGEAWLHALPASKLSELQVTGQLLLARLDTKPGPWLGRLLGELLEAVALGLLPNDQEALLEAAQLNYAKIRETEKR
ncbi:CCA tRNA nucleotidyltransferase [Paenibacillus cremeus]|uniref:CCA tRNA nucleotidyltransferase n=1 Tax=Paenibacillus cremeus TaxID=2163881 RepID=A0A559KHQ5_9BACL|nr:CCA tRNA nucleotidyltransferase [Paenibacillus cremeus]TVY11646.1 CCA tRNA nucleotidyltransferase [Paenibacillus cremeus]